eukprot:CAMPEP_0194428004 /NCGR_PEP_ID=MMETSP0176-20130528/39566_1 /TAXON_ID=216777 /ORGANISM="Proboscia alata, Strain PI-D3" /LENGTH=78 /DNA_ID=CAMNT_0039240127 /DNA_START=35 /DNA_END=268 /DNA_ORIENTATION=+
METLLKFTRPFHGHPDATSSASVVGVVGSCRPSALEEDVRGIMAAPIADNSVGMLESTFAPFLFLPTKSKSVTSAILK